MTRCPGCGAGVRAGTHWCTLCYADLRPAPPPAPEPVRAPVPVPVPVPEPPAVDPLTAPLPVVLGEAPPAAEARWPCLRCGERNPIADDHCGTCGAPFGGSRTPATDKEARLRRALVAVGGVLLFLALFAAVVFATTGEPPPKPEKVVDQNADLPPS